MARVLHDGHHRDHDRGHRDCGCGDRDDTTGDVAGISDDDRRDGRRHHRHDHRDCSDSTGDVAGISDDDRRDRRRRRRRRERLIPVGTIEIDCSPVSFRTPGQARNVVTCPLTTTMNTLVTETVIVETPTGTGCVTRTPVTRVVTVPVTTTVGVPPTLVPVPVTVCPENVLCAEEQNCPSTVAADTHRRKRGCGCGH